MGIFDGCLLASDIDATLIDGDGIINERCLEKIRYFVSEGGAFSLATGRSVGAVSSVVSAIDYLSPSVVANGAMIYDYNKKEILHQLLLPDSDKRAVAEILSLGADIGIEIHSGKQAIVVHRNAETDDHESYEDFEATFMTIDEALHYDWTKILFAFTDFRDIERAEELILSLNLKSQLLNTTAFVYGTQRRYLELVPMGVSKADALARLCDLLRINNGCFYAIGDYYNDVPMLDSADICAAPIDSPEDIKDKVDVIVSTAKDGAVADFIDYLTERKTKK